MVFQNTSPNNFGLITQGHVEKHSIAVQFNDQQ
jgi:hypothetical protein